MVNAPDSGGSGYDLNVARQAYQTASGMGASAKVMLALFEAGIVESRFQNLSGGDRDSAGFLQQRPSQGWGSKEQVMNVAYATTQFVTKAKKIENSVTTSGQLAQAVQRSAYPLRYDAASLNAQALLKQVSGSTAVPPAGSTTNVGGGGLGEAVSTITNPHTWLRVAMILAGGILVIAALALLGWDSAPPIAKTVVKAVVTKKVPLK